MALLGIDLGTTGCKCLITDNTLGIKGKAYSEYPLIKTPDGKIEQSADDWWDVTKKTVKQAVISSDIDPEAIESIGITTQGISFVLVDKDIKQIRNSINWLDARAAEEKRLIDGVFGEQEIFKIAGRKIGASSVLAKLLWLRRHEPENYKKAYKILTAHDYILCKLCGETITDHTMAAGTHMYDIRKRDWSDEILNEFEIDRNLLPEIKDSGTCISGLCKTAACELGMRHSTKVAVGAQDQKCAVIGIGISENISTLSLGTSAALIKTTRECVIDADMKMSIQPGCFNDFWLFEGVIGTACASLNWYKNNFLKNYTYSQMNKIASEAGRQENGIFFYPHLSGSGTPYMNKQMRGFIYGLSLSATAEEILAGIYAGISFQILTNLKLMENLSGVSDEIRIMGGGSNSEGWCKTIADVLNKTVVRTDTPETAALGAVMLAGKAAGIFSDIYSAYKYIKIKDDFVPNTENHLIYEQKYEQYLKIEEALNEVFRVHK